MSRSLPSNKPLRVALTGGIGSGKSVVAKFWQVLGIPVFNADLEARSILATSPEVRTAIINLFGEEAYQDNMPNRAWIAQCVFGNEEALNALNAIVHPAVGRAYEAWILRHSAWPYLLKEAAIVLELGQKDAYDAVVLVTAPLEIRVQRVMKRNQLTEAEVMKRVESQWTDAQKRSLSNFEIANDDRTALIPQVLGLHEQLILTAAKRGD